jgi:hypothetical protein
MAATADPNEVIQLPRLRPGDLGTLMLELASTAHATVESLNPGVKQAKKKHAPADDSPLPAAVPARITEALADLEAARPGLVDALKSAGPATTLTAAQRALDLKMNASWRCVRLAYELGEQLANARGDEALAERCRQGRKRVLPQGIGFISLVGRDEYTVSDAALGVLEGEQAGLFRTLPSGAELLREVRHVHDQYGVAFHITAASPATKPETALVAKAVAEAAAATREYVAAVVGSVRRADRRTRALADRLLAPLANYGRTPAVPAAPSEEAAKGEKTPSAPLDPTRA